MGVFEELDGRFRVTGTYSRAEIADLQLTGDGSLATVKARVLIGLELEDAQGEPVDSSNVVTHDLLLCRSRADWLIVSDDYLDPATPKYLRLAGAPAWMVREARVALRQAGYVRPPNAAVETVRRYLTLLDRRRVSEAGRLLVPSLGGRRLEFGVAHVKFLSAGLEGPLRDGTLTLGVDFLVTDSVPPCDWENGRHQLSFELVRDEGSGVWRIAGWHAG